MTVSTPLVNYLGDWHSHPNTFPDLSMLDKRTLTKIALTPESRCPNPIMIIFGEKPTKWKINAVRFQSGKTRMWSFCRCVYEYLGVISDIEYLLKYIIFSISTGLLVNPSLMTGVCLYFFDGRQ